MIQPGQILDDKFEIKELLGKGGMGAVFVATHAIIGRKVAIKVLHPEYSREKEILERFHREARAAALIGHENIVEVTDVGLARDRSPYLVMELLRGECLYDVLKREKKLPIERAVRICGQILSALDAAHNKGIIHRDLKPENIFLTMVAGRRDFVKLLDFGISKFTATATTGVGLTRTGFFLGTPYYMAPEQALGRDVDHRIDIYAVAIMLYEMVSGKLPFDAPNLNALLYKIVSADPVPASQALPGIPDDFAQVIMKGMSSDRENRFASAKHFFKALEPFGARDITSPLPSLPPASPSADTVYDDRMADEPAVAPKAAPAPVPAAVPPKATAAPTAEPLSEPAAPSKSYLEVVPEEVGHATPYGSSIIGEQDFEPRKRGYGAPIAVTLIVLFILAAAGGAFYMIRERNKRGAEEAGVSIPIELPVTGKKDEPVEPPETSGTVLESVEAQGFLLRLAASPADAHFKVDGKAVKGNPLEIRLSGGEEHTIAANAKGYVKQEKIVQLEEDMDLGFVLLRPGEASDTSGKEKKVEVLIKEIEKEKGKEVVIITPVEPREEKPEKKSSGITITKLKPGETSEKEKALLRPSEKEEKPEAKIKIKKLGPSVP